MFERLYCASLALSAINTALGYDATMAQLKADPAIAAMGMANAGFFLGTLALVYAVALLLWFLTARRASNIARWILTLLTALGALSVALSSGKVASAQSLATLLGTALQIGAIVCLFRRDARAWFAGDSAGAGPAAIE
ncbi:MAG: hypothetical protein GC147_12550 [Porphyrobacter sp.]|nr:hypothetical protein [Porphyrobacter sp.]